MDPTQDTTQEQDKPKKVSWVKVAYQRAAWLRVTYGKMVKPHWEQKSNLDLSNAEVLQPRVEPVSFAFPLVGRGDMGSTEDNGRHQVHGQPSSVDAGMI